MPELDKELSAVLAESRVLAEEYREASLASMIDRGLMDEHGVLTEAGEARQQAMTTEFIDAFPEPSDPAEVRILGSQVLQQLQDFKDTLS